MVLYPGGCILDFETLIFLRLIFTRSVYDLGICSLPKMVGVCKASFTNYYFNMETKKCEEFVYGGCGGNANRFETMEECAQVCAKG